METQFWSLRSEENPDGLVSYQQAREIQLDLVDLRARDLIPDTFLFLEHFPVITRGRGILWTGQPREGKSQRHMPLPWVPPGVDFSESERGGDLTYHGPGQLVIYPICKLDGTGWGAKHDIARFLRKLEEILIQELEGRGLERVHCRENATGVWVGDQKIASIGIAVKKWVTYHGVALNCVNDLGPFQWIYPCGFHPDVMARLVDLAPKTMAHPAPRSGGGPPRPEGQGLPLLDDSEWRRSMEASLAQRLGSPNSRVKNVSATFLQDRLKAQAAPDEWLGCL